MRKLIIRFLAWLLTVVDPPASELYFVFSDGTTTHKVKHMNSTIKSGGLPLLLAVVCADALGNAVKPSVSVSDAALGTATLSEDGKQITVTPLGLVGKFTLTVSAGTLSATDEIEVVAGDAATLTLTEIPATV